MRSRRGPDLICRCHGRDFRLVEPQSQLRGIGEHALRPGRVPDQVDLHILDSIERLDLVPHILLENGLAQPECREILM